MSDVRIEGATRPLRGSVRVPGDKSASHRALMLAALASGESVIHGLSQGHDVASTSAILVALGAQRSDVGDVVHFEGPRDGLYRSPDALDCGNSGTTMRLMSGIMSSVPGEHRLVGDASLSRRPMDRVAIPLALMGATVEGSGERVCAPLRVTGHNPLRAINFHVPEASAQVKSAILLAGLRADGPTTVFEDIRTRTTTEDMLRLAGVDVSSVDIGAGRSVTVQPGRPKARTWVVPGDPSQAAFFVVLGSIAADAEITVTDIDLSPERRGFLDVLERMGADVSTSGSSELGSVTARSSSLHATEVLAEEIPSVDEVPILTVAAAAAQGVSAFRDMGELRLKESDRFATSMALAASLGCRVWSEGDDFFVEGLGSARRFLDFSYDAGLDHRLVMSSAVAGTAGNGCAIANAATVASSYPNFFDDLWSL